MIPLIEQMDKNELLLPEKVVKTLDQADNICIWILMIFLCELDCKNLYFSRN